MVTRKLSRIAYWLVPKEPERYELQKLIAGLAVCFKAPLFVPHVTLYSCRRTASSLDLPLLATLAATTPPVTMIVEHLACKEKLTQALFVKLQNNELATSLNRRLHAAVSQSSNYKFDPHLSLLYQNIPRAQRLELAGEIKLRSKKIRFDELWAVSIPEQLDTIKALSGWQLLLTVRLASRPIVDTIVA